MELGSDAGSSRSSASSQSNSAKVTPCSECQPSPSPGSSLDLVSALEDYEEPFPLDPKKGTDEWTPGEDDEDDEDERAGRDDRCPARGPGAVSSGTRGGGGGSRRATTAMPPPLPNGNLHPHDPQDLGHNGNVVVAGRPRGPRQALQKPQPADGGPEESPVPPMDWEALEKHLAGLQFREQEVRNQGPARTNSTSVSWPGACPGARTRPRPARARPSPFIPGRGAGARILPAGRGGGGGQSLGGGGEQRRGRQPEGSRERGGVAVRLTVME